MYRHRLFEFLRHLLRFGVAGTAVSAVQGGVYVGLVALGWTGPVLASVIAFLAGTVVSFTVHYHWTFESTRDPMRAAWRFGVARLAGLGVNTGGVFLLTKVLLLSPYWGLAFMLVITPLTVFTIAKFWAFRDIDEYQRAPRET